jgi:streptogramin lyase
MKGAARLITLSVATLAIALVASRAATAVTITEFPLPTAGSRPLWIAAGPDGNLWFTEYTYFGDFIPNKIGRITRDGVITEFSIPTAGSLPFGIAAGPDGNLWFTEAAGNKIGRITPAGDITEFPLPANGGPLGICLGPDGALWFAENAANKIGRITPAGAITEFMLPAGVSPWTIASGPDGNLWFTEFMGSKIGRITTDGVVTEFPLGKEAWWITAGPDGNLWFTEDLAKKIGRITPAGDITEFPLPPGGSPLGICLGPDGALWFTENSNPSKIGRITTSGVITEFTFPTANSLPEGICLGPGGELWFAEMLGDKIGRISFGLSYYTLPPCRVLDTRDATGALGGPALDPNQPRSFPFAGVCGIPSDAIVVSGNVTVVAPSASGDFRAYAADQSVPPTTVINFRAGNVRANNLVVSLSGDGTQSVMIQNDSVGTANVVFDVNGYFK